MNLPEARKILGLGPEDDPRPFLPEFKQARDRIAEMVRNAPNETLAARYQQGLADFDKALTSVHEYLEALGLAPVEEQTPPVIPASMPPVPETIPAPSPDPSPPGKKPTFVWQKIVPRTTPPPPPEPPAAVPAPLPPPSEPTASPVPSSAFPVPSSAFPVPTSEFSVPTSSEPQLPPSESPSLPPEPSPPVAEPPAPSVPPSAFRIPPSTPPVPPSSAGYPFPDSKVLSPNPEAPPVPDQTLPSSEPRKKRSTAAAIWLLTIILLAVAGGLSYLKVDEDRRLKNMARVAFLERQGAILVENRRWPDATKVYDEIESIAPKSELVTDGRRKIAEGMAEEQSQFVGYWTGQARASLEASRWDEAETAAKTVLDKFPKEKEAIDLLAQIAAARAAESDRTALANARESLSRREFDAAISAATKILASRPGDEDANLLLRDATAAKEKAAGDLLKAKALLEQARTRDQGQFDQQVLDWLREANALAPEDTDIKAHLEKIAAYARTVRVPGDFKTPSEALANARDRDRIIIAAGTWDGPLTVNASVDLQGAGAETTIVQCAAQTANAITLGPGAKGARITGISFRHQSFDPGEQRFSAALVRGAAVDFVDCRFLEASGHGLAVIEGGHATVSRCRFSDSGWNGISASGAGSLLDVRQCESLRNFGHGIESWDGAAVILNDNRCQDNSRNGIHADNGGGSVTIEKNQLVGNREFGLVLGSAASGKVSGNIARGNMLGGFVIRSTASAVSFVSNEATKNDGPGLILDIGLLAANYGQNSNSGNAGQQVLVNANLTVKDEIPAEAPADPTKPPRALPVLEDE